MGRELEPVTLSRHRGMVRRSLSERCSAPSHPPWAHSRNSSKRTALKKKEDRTLHRSRPSGPLAPACPQVSYRPENVHFLVRSPQRPAHILELGGYTHLLGASQVALVVKNPPTNAEDMRDMGLIPGLGRSLGGENGNSLQYSFLENPHGQRSLAGYSP